VIEVITPHPAKGILVMLGKTHRAIGERHNFSPAFIGRCLNGRAAVTPRLRAALVAETGLPESELFLDDAVQAAAQRLVARAVADGLPATVNDAETLRRIAGLMRAAS
jgi:hypothetical protein